ncbi:hypothetical protein K435DRAFT_876716 [Dendrothele bispora CBS 962.96]|uniref:Uncharacterized protein n=1 Tax=Dendrothele bispora (strain CBS 962.96) TaxID=1314807 RepID=A0A4S8KRV1_DENBC|nr:hypothetical protein K435DRAFT_876716 [Dendrothele bispora CBS 962.96]
MEVDSASSFSERGSSILDSDFEESVNWPYHPLDLINEHILKMCPDAHVAISHDQDWMSVMHKLALDNGLSDEFTLMNLITEKYTDCSEGCVSLKMGDCKESQDYGFAPGVDGPFKDPTTLLKYTNDFHHSGNIYVPSMGHLPLVSLKSEDGMAGESSAFSINPFMPNYTSPSTDSFADYTLAMDEVKGSWDRSSVKSSMWSEAPSVSSYSSLAMTGPSRHSDLSQEDPPILHSGKIKSQHPYSEKTCQEAFRSWS